MAQGPDLPWQFGQEWPATRAAKRGIMLLLHGCNGYLPDSKQMAWVNYYRAIGFRVIMPNSFAETHDPESCGSSHLNNAEVYSDRSTRNLKLRISQTLRTIAGIRQKYPSEPLFIHGHSEAGWVAQALGAKVDGIITTGTICGFGISKVHWAAKGVPMLLIVGTRDASVGVKSAAALNSTVGGQGHRTNDYRLGRRHGSLCGDWWPEVEAAVSKFLKVPSVEIGRPSTDSVAYPNMPISEQERYAKAHQHKALAAYNKVLGIGALIAAVHSMLKKRPCSVAIMRRFSMSSLIPHTRIGARSSMWTARSWSNEVAPPHVDLVIVSLLRAPAQDRSAVDFCLIT